MSLVTPSSRTLRFRTLTASDIMADEIVVSATDATEKRGHLPLWTQLATTATDQMIGIRTIDRERISIDGPGCTSKEVALDDEAAIDAALSYGSILLDISGFQHHVWAPLLRSLHARNVKTRVLYAEPEEYKEHPNPSSASLFDLSVTFDGLAPLPGFARLSGPIDESKCLFVAMLGFEGSRPESLVFQLDPMPKVIPVVGVPGFQAEYPSYTVECNRTFLEECKAHHEIRFARASCPFESFDVLAEIRKDYSEHYMYLAPIGTKPHALGVVLYALANPDHTEIMFDHPVRRPGRTKGVGVIHIYDLGNCHGI
jgi:hypothetical protein